MDTPKKTCLNCGKTLEGRSDKKYCDPYCKSAYQYRKNKEKEASLFVKIDKQLRLNRRILKTYNKAGKTTVRKEVLLKKGFNPHFFTHYWKAKNGNVYLFCYEFGFMKQKENKKHKYVLIQWQKYMEKKH